jgi:hypothetical protein
MKKRLRRFFETARVLVRLDHRAEFIPYQKSRRIQGTMQLLLVISNAA